MTVDEVSIKTWVKRGIFQVNTSALEFDDPDHPYNQIVAQGGVPEHFGYRHPLAEEFDRYSRYQLVTEIIELRKELEAARRAGF